MSLSSQLLAVTQKFEATAPSHLKDPINRANTGFQATFDPSLALQPGRPFPSFSLSNALGTTVSLSTLLEKGPVLITFYRGSWCPFCNLALHDLQKHLPEFTSLGITLVAISPELPDTSLTTIEKNALEFEVLSDIGNILARELGILFQQPKYMKAVFDTFGHDFQKRNGDDSLEVPVPATFLVGRDGVVKRRFVDADWTKRVEGDEVVGWVMEL